MEREDIIKALECCTSYCDKDNCPYKTHDFPIACMTMRMVDALSLIKELTEVAERREGVEESPVDSSTPSVTELQRENERLKARVLEENHLRHQAEEMLANGMSAVKADTVRKMQTEIKKTFSAICKGEMVVLYRIIDQIAKEMLEDTNES